MSLKLREENQIFPLVESLMNDDSVVSDELFLLASNIKREVINVFNIFLSFLRVYDKRKAHNMISLMLDPKYKNLCIVSSFVGKEQGVVLVEKYDRKSLYPMLLKCL
jgi:myosin-crossreactive antigen